MSKLVFGRKDFGAVRLIVEATEKEVKVWACSLEEGISVLRIKAMGKVHGDLSKIKELVVTQK